ncbi:alpha-glucosidase precursor [Lindgomyces ingoldianus]|uniref:Alpha-glucosidase n=1 Tax=Lindgomyces ingoldianus TaxID=673940 RepID=A0ACB6QHI5_9PLEO|nr:alpha-glucosidase precursor [Lindgomyces ingoldianus]KAF2465606.1 alpha-glucosidase precursor [Lindgomyces ingoldianus]
MFTNLILTLVTARLAVAVPAPRYDVPPDPPNVNISFPPTSLGTKCPGYVASNIVKTDSSLTADLTLAGPACTLYSEDLTNLRLLVEYQTNDRLHVKIYDADLSVFQVQEEILPRPPNNNAQSSNAALQFDLVEKPFSFTVRRKENNETLFDTSSTQLIFESQYVRLRTKLPTNPNLYGLGEHSDPFRLPTQKYQRVMFNAESPFIPHNSNLYGSHPVYFEHRGDKGTHGVFLLNSDPMNININRTDDGGQYLEYNTIGGVIDLYFMAGKGPADVSKQYADIVGYSPMYPYWTFGFHQCKYGYWDVNYVAEVVANYSTANIPLEVMWTDIDHMNLRQDFTLDPERFPLQKMRELVATLHSRDQRYVLIQDPGIHANMSYATYARGLDRDVFLKNADGSPYLGVQWPGVVAWPDWFAPNTKSWWTDEIMRIFNPETGVDIDGIWVDMNEASNFCHDPNCNPTQLAIDEGDPPPPQHSPRNNTGRPIPGFPVDFQPTTTGSPSIKARNSKPLYPRQTGNGTMKGLPNRDYFNFAYHVNNHRGNLSDFTIYLNNTNRDGTKQYDTHNFYGHMMSHTTHSSMLTRRPSLRPFVLTRSTFAGSGRKVSHWFGDNESSWEHYRTSIRQMLAFVAMHQMPLVGSDVCGFNNDASEYMCARWALLGAFQPFYRNHAEISARPQEFYQWPKTILAAQKAISTRYKLLDYIYTALYHQTTDGTPMINPLFFLYPNDANTFNIQHQWFYGDAILVSPVTTDFSDSVTFYLPQDTFYDFWTHEQVNGQGMNVTKSNLTELDIPVHIRGGTIIPMRTNSANTTKALRRQDFVVLVAPGADGTAKGRLYLDDGESIQQDGVSEIEFTWDGRKFAAAGKFGYGGMSGESLTVEKVTVLGQEKAGQRGVFDAGERSVTVQGPWKLEGAFGFEV